MNGSHCHAVVIELVLELIISIVSGYWYHYNK